MAFNCLTQTSELAYVKKNHPTEGRTRTAVSTSGFPVNLYTSALAKKLPKK